MCVLQRSKEAFFAFLWQVFCGGRLRTAGLVWVEGVGECIDARRDLDSYLYGWLCPSPSSLQNKSI